jgi:murein L,D-transpeptidase YafK
MGMLSPITSRFRTLALVAAVTGAAAPAAMAQAWSESPADQPPNPTLLAPAAANFTPEERARRLSEKGMAAGSPVMIRIFKAESELELWLKKGETFELFATYPICFWSGRLGPKLREGDKQAPEGIYTVGTQQLHYRGRLPRSLDIGFPNRFDRSHARTGSYILVHGACQSIGCYAMTDTVMEEIFALSEQALHEGQGHIQLQVFPFRMTEANLKFFADHAWHEFWRDLKTAHDMFERTRVPPKVGVCEKRYVVTEGSNLDMELPAGAWDALMPCEKEEAEAALWQLPQADREVKRVARVIRRHIRRAGRNTRKAYAAARRARVIAHSKRMRTSDVGAGRRAN